MTRRCGRSRRRRAGRPRRAGGRPAGGRAGCASTTVLATTGIGAVEAAGAAARRPCDVEDGAMSGRLPGAGRLADLPDRLRRLDEAVERSTAGSTPTRDRRARAVLDAGRGAAAAVGRSTPSSRSPARPAAASRRCSTRSPGCELSPVGVRRPTTASPHACVWGPEGAGAAARSGSASRAVTRSSRRDRAGRASGRRPLRGLVLLDLPDHDSTDAVPPARGRPAGRAGRPAGVGASTRRSTPTTLLHERYLRPLAGTRRSPCVVLNQIDTLTPPQVGRVRRRPAAAAGRRRPSSGAPVLTASAPTGAGVDGAASAAGRRGPRRRARSRPAGRPTSTGRRVR